MLGSVVEAEDAVQEAWLRLQRTQGSGGIVNLEAWLTTVVGRVCLDVLRARRARREQYVGSWLPEPLAVEAVAGPEDEALLAESVGIALLVVLETLSPAERLAYVLHDMFGLRFEEIAPIAGRSEGAVRQLASRARRRVRTAAPDADTDVVAQRSVVDAFLAAARGGDFERLLAVLDPEVVLRIDVGGVGAGAAGELVGGEAVAAELLARGAVFAPFARPALVNGQAGLVTIRDGRVLAAIAFTLVAGRVVEIDIVADPAKLGRVSVGR